MLPALATVIAVKTMLSSSKRSGEAFVFCMQLAACACDLTSRSDHNEAELHALALGDALLHRMSTPVRASELDLNTVKLVPRFGVEQGLRPDGSVKIRAVDHFSWSHRGAGPARRTRREVKVSSVNGHYTPDMQITHEHLDDLHVVMRRFHCRLGRVPWLFKADIDAAFRRVPVRESHKWAAGVAYLFEDEIWASIHHGMPFGATSSVVAWQRVGALISTLARKLLHIPVLRYVDDFFAPERYAVHARLLCTRTCTAVASLAGRRQWKMPCGHLPDSHGHCWASQRFR